MTRVAWLDVRVRPLFSKCNVLNEIRESRCIPPVHDGRWGMANLEVCLAVLESSEKIEEVFLQHQIALNDWFDEIGKGEVEDASPNLSAFVVKDRG